MIEITMPRLSDTMEEGSIATWRKHPGDHVEPGDILVDIETDKATMEYEAYEAGTLTELLVAEGEVVTIGTPIALLDTGVSTARAVADASPVRVAPQPATPAESAQPSSDAGLPVVARPLVAHDTLERQFASPLVRRVAREHHLELSGVRGTGPGGRIIRRDLAGLLGPSHDEDATASSTGLTPPLISDERRGSEAVALSNTRRVIARRLGESARTIPHFYVTSVVDADALVTMRSELNRQLTAVGRPKVSVNDLLVRACALALVDHPSVNASYVDDLSTVMYLHHRVNIGIAVASEHGLVVPVINDANQKTVSQLGTEARELAALANEKKLSLEQMSGGTFTISNLGMFGVEQFTAIINPPEGAILAVGATSLEPRVINGAVVARHTMRYTLSSDHRIIDGALAANFLATVTTYLENPWSLVA